MVVRFCFYGLSSDHAHVDQDTVYSSYWYGRLLEVTGGLLEVTLELEADVINVT